MPSNTTIIHLPNSTRHSKSKPSAASISLVRSTAQQVMKKPQARVSSLASMPRLPHKSVLHLSLDATHHTSVFSSTTSSLVESTNHTAYSHPAQNSASPSAKTMH